LTGRLVCPEVSPIGIESATAGLANNVPTRQRARNGAFSIARRNVRTGSRVGGGIESEVLIVVPSLGSG